MATPIGHALAGYAVYSASSSARQKSDRLLPWLCVALAISPDFDFIPGLLIGQPAFYHQWMSHSLIFALAVGLGVSVAVYGRLGVSVCRWGLLSASYASHLCIDLFSPDGRPPFGIPLLWPLSQAPFRAPFDIFWGVHHASGSADSTDEWFAGMMDIYNIGAVASETGIVLCLLAMVRIVKGCMSRSSLGRERGES